MADDTVKTYRIESSHKLQSDWLPALAFTHAMAVATAIEGVDDPEEQEVRVVCVENGAVVCTEHEYK